MIYDKQCTAWGAVAAVKVLNVMNVHAIAPDQVRSIKPAGQPSTRVGDSKTSVRQLDILLTWRGRVGLFKKSGHCSSVSMPWQLLSVTQADSCSTLGDGLLQCIQLLHRGTGLTVRDILAIQSLPPVELSHGSQCTAHFVYLVETSHRRLALGPGYSMYRWVKLPKIARFDGGVDWLAPILEAVVPRASKPQQKVQAGETPEGESPTTGTGVLVSNPKPDSRTSKPAVSVATRVLGEPPGLVRDPADVHELLITERSSSVHEMTKSGTD